MEDEVFMDEYDEHEIEDYDVLDDMDLDWPGVEVFDPQHFEYLALEIENRQLDSWMERQEEKAGRNVEQPGHHDQDRIWQLEDNLRKGRR